MTTPGELLTIYDIIQSYQKYEWEIQSRELATLFKGKQDFTEAVTIG